MDLKPFLTIAMLTIFARGDIVCPPGRSLQKLTIGTKQQIGYRTQSGELYGENTRCRVDFERESSCPSLVVSCHSFDLVNSWNNCSGPPDYLDVGGQRFCQKSGPINVTSRASKLTVSFASNRQYAGYGAECTVACTDFETEDQPTEDRCCESMASMLEEMKVQTSLLQDIKQLMPPLETASTFSTVDETMDPWSSTTTTGTNVPTSSITTGTTTEHYTCLGGTVIPIDKVCDGVFDCPQSENSDGGEDEDDETCCESGFGSTGCCGSGSGSSGCGEDD